VLPQIPLVDGEELAVPPQGLCSRWWSTFDVWDVAVGGVGRGVGSDSNTGPNP